MSKGMRTAVQQREVEMDRIVVRRAVKRRPGMLYYIDSKGNLCEAPLDTAPPRPRKVTRGRQNKKGKSTGRTVSDVGRKAVLSDEELRRRATEAVTRQARRTETVQFPRDPYVSAYAKKRANGRCELCEREAPFILPSGEPFLESHHIVPLTEGGQDEITNVVALCPNCHRKMHHLGLAEDREILLGKVREKGSVSPA